jgi:hypothetical protein
MAAVDYSNMMMEMVKGVRLFAEPSTRLRAGRPPEGFG